MRTAPSSGLAQAPLPAFRTLIGWIVAGACSACLAQTPEPAFDPHDLRGHWDRASPIESFANTPGALRQGGDDQREAPFTAAGRARFDGNMPGYGPRRQMQRNDPMGRCEPLGLPRHLNAEIIPPHATFEIVQLPERILQFFEYRHDWREIWMDGRALMPSGA